MMIDWFTVIAQIINFLVLVWLLKRFLYKPILNAIDDRDKKIKMQIQEAEDRTTEAKKEREEFSKKNADFDQQRSAMMTKATEEAQATKKQLLEEARKEGDALRLKLKQAMHEEQQSLNNAIIQRTQHEVFAIARKVLSDLASTTLEDEMIRVFVGRMQDLPKDEKAQFIKTLTTSGEAPVIHSAMELTAEQQKKVTNAIKELANTTVDPRFETAEDRISGIELTCGGYKMGWSISEYLKSLEQRFSEVLPEQPSQHIKLEEPVEEHK